VGRDHQVGKASDQLGRGLTRSRSRIDAGLDEGQVVRREIVIARCDLPTLFDLIEEPFDHVAGSVVMWAEADRLIAIASPAVGASLNRKRVVIDDRMNFAGQAAQARDRFRSGADMTRQARPVGSVENDPSRYFAVVK
jgi:hypothetical protein